jgi:hypothetical protein
LRYEPRRIAANVERSEPGEISFAMETLAGLVRSEHVGLAARAIWRYAALEAVYIIDLGQTNYDRTSSQAVACVSKLPAPFALKLDQAPQQN